MRSIPTVVASDAEDVIWALQTADALWKRQERVDAIVWLRRAAQAAGEAEDDDRALALARDAAELAEWIAQNPGAEADVLGAPTPAPPAASDAVDDLLREPTDDTSTDDTSLEDPTPAIDIPVSMTAPPTAPRSPPPPPPRSPAPPAMHSAPPAPAHVPTAAEAHAGMLDPWSDPEAPTRNRPVVPPPIPVAPLPPAAAPAAVAFESDEVVTSAPRISALPAELRTPAEVKAEAKMHAAPAPPPRPPPRPGPPPTPSRAQPPPKAPPKPATQAPPPAAAVQAAPAPPQAAVAPETAPADAAPAERIASNGVDLSQVEALSDLPDDARDAFAAAAEVRTLAREDEVSAFALALVLEGDVDVAATIVDAPAQRMGAGAVMRARGTIEQFAPVRLIGATATARVATWDEQAVTEAFRTCPWVEDELRAAGDRLQALVGITMGPLGERLDPSLRADVMSRLQLRTLAEHEVIATRGGATVGLLVVGGGELEVLGEDGNPNGTVLGPGEFLFPNESLRAAPAPSTVRASTGGALVLLAERGVAQELLVTCPPLLEIFAGM